MEKILQKLRHQSGKSFFVKQLRGSVMLSVVATGACLYFFPFGKALFFSASFVIFLWCCLYSIGRYDKVFIHTHLQKMYLEQEKVYNSSVLGEQDLLSIFRCITDDPLYAHNLMAERRMVSRRKESSKVEYPRNESLFDCPASLLSSERITPLSSEEVDELKERVKKALTGNRAALLLAEKRMKEIRSLCS